MDPSSWALMATFVFLMWLLLRGRQLVGYKLPPGPTGLPLLGCFWVLFYELHFVFTHMSKKWGDIFCINIMGQNHVVLNTPQVVREAYASQATGDKFAGRPPAPSFAMESLIHSTTFLCPSPTLTRQRKLVHKILNMYGDGVSEMENTVQEELKHAVNWLESKEEIIDMDEVIYPSLINILTILLTGRRHEYDSKVLQNVQLMDESAARGSTTSNNILMSIFPFLKQIPLGPGRYAIENIRSTKQFEKDFFYEAKASYDPQVTRGMIDVLLRHQEESKLEDESVWPEDRSVKAVVQEMVGAGSITTRGALYSFFLIIAHKPDVAKRIQDEIEVVVGSGRFSRLADRSQMPFTMAVIFELLRYISHVPIGIPRVTTGDVMLRGYFIPSQTIVMANMWQIHHDEKLWPNPWEFQPERFLDEQGKLLPTEHPNRKNTMPFGIGRRSCVGETFARSRIFLFITTLLQRFDFRPDPSRPLPPCDPRTFKGGLVFSPEKYYLRVVPRR